MIKKIIIVFNDKTNYNNVLMILLYLLLLLLLSFIELDIYIGNSICLYVVI